MSTPALGARTPRGLSAKDGRRRSAGRPTRPPPPQKKPRPRGKVATSASGRPGAARVRSTSRCSRVGDGRTRPRTRARSRCPTRRWRAGGAPRAAPARASRPPSTTARASSRFIRQFASCRTRRARGAAHAPRDLGAPTDDGGGGEDDAFIGGGRDGMLARGRAVGLSSSLPRRPPHDGRGRGPLCRGAAAPFVELGTAFCNDMRARFALAEPVPRPQGDVAHRTRDAGRQFTAYGAEETFGSPPPRRSEKLACIHHDSGRLHAKRCP